MSASWYTPTKCEMGYYTELWTMFLSPDTNIPDLSSSTFYSEKHFQDALDELRKQIKMKNNKKN